jgi:hypothetical protein
VKLVGYVHRNAWMEWSSLIYIPEKENENNRQVCWNPQHKWKFVTNKKIIKNSRIFYMCNKYR